MTKPPAHTSHKTSAGHGRSAQAGTVQSLTDAAVPRHLEGRGALQTAFDHFAARVTRWAGSPGMFCAALLLVLCWALSGPLFQFSENWQLVINTGTTIVTFLMVFLIQQSQNKDSVAVHLKLDELLAAHRGASNRMIGIEDLDEGELRELAEFYKRLAEKAKKAEEELRCAHSIDEAAVPVGRSHGSSRDSDSDSNSNNNNSKSHGDRDKAKGRRNGGEPPAEAPATYPGPARLSGG